MDNRWTRLYNKVMDFYSSGSINKALEICEKILGEDLGASEILNLKGLILYQKGLLKEARTVWKLNYDINKDNMARKYIEDCESDEERLKIYKDAEYNLRNMNIDKALMLFNECAKSDFNSIKVNTGIAMCYQRKGDNYRAKEYVDRALMTDNEAVTANKVKNELIKLGIYSDTHNLSKRLLSVITVLFIISSLCLAGYFIYKKVILNNTSEKNDYTVLNEEKNNSENDTENLEKDSNESEETNSSENSDSKENSEDNEKKVIEFNKDEVTKSLQDKDVDKLYDEITGVDKNSLSQDDLDLYNKAVKTLETDGVSKFYEFGVWYFNNQNYNSAQKSLEKAYKYCDESYLKEHILFYRGSTASQLDDNAQALTLYKEYYNLYPKGSYIEGVLYELALLTTPTNKDMGKQYAKELVDKYPNSMYINDRINQLLN
mgnify:CR=1 FL=1